MVATFFIKKKNIENCTNAEGGNSRASVGQQKN